MRFGMMAAAAAALMCTGQAEAADYLTFTFTVSGTVNRNINVAPPGSDIHQTYSITGPIVLIVPFAAAGQTSASYFIPNAGSSQYYENYSLSTSGNMLTIADDYESRLGGKGDYRTVSLSVCGDFTAGIPSGSVSVDPTCSSASFFRGIFLGSFVGGDGADFKGTVTALSVNAASGTPAAFGVTYLPVTPIPEPATWAMMIAGFGAIGSLMRRRSRHRAFAA